MASSCPTKKLTSRGAKSKVHPSSRDCPARDGFQSPGWTHQSGYFLAHEKPVTTGRRAWEGLQTSRLEITERVVNNHAADRLQWALVAVLAAELGTLVVLG